MTTTVRRPDPGGALTFFKVMAIVVGIGLLVLVTEMVFSYVLGWNGEPGNRSNPLAWWPQPHGFLFILYVIATANLGFKVGWSLPRMIGIMLAGCVPLFSFWVERRVAAELGGARVGVPSGP